MSYIGETPIKKYARVYYWKHVAGLMGGAFLTRKHVFLASEHAGDASTLLAMGCKPGNIVAVDLDPKACDRVRRTFPGIDVRCGDVSEILEGWNGDHPGSIYLDFCANLSKKLQGTVRRATDACPGSMVLGINLLKGRDGWFTRKQLMVMDLKALLRHTFGIVFDNYRTKHGGFRTRIPLLDGVYTYKTASPMAIGVYAFSWGPVDKPYINGETIWDYVDPVFIRDPNRSTLNDGTVRVHTTEWYMRAGMPVTRIPAFRMGDVRRDCLSNALGPRTAQLLNVPERTVTAWRAHATMGTYDTAAE